MRTDVLTRAGVMDASAMPISVGIVVPGLADRSYNVAQLDTGIGTTVNQWDASASGEKLAAELMIATDTALIIRAH